MNGQGLAAQPVMDGSGQGMRRGMQDMLPQVVELLRSGVSPEDLVARGVPVELIEMAMAQLSQEATAIPTEQAGLAGMQLS
jgi:hypothetical protein